MIEGLRLVLRLNYNFVWGLSHVFYCIGDAESLAENADEENAKCMDEPCHFALVLVSHCATGWKVLSPRGFLLIF